MNRLTFPNQAASNHPVRRHRVRAFLAETNLVRLLVLFAGGVVAAALPLAAFLSLDEGGSLLRWWVDVTLSLLGNEPPSMQSAAGKGDGAAGVQILTSFGAVLLPAIVLGAVVYKVFLLQRVFQFRSASSLMWSEQGWIVALRMYNSTPMNLVDVDFEAFLRAKVSLGRRRHMVINQKLKLVKPTWPISQPSIPFSVQILLSEGDVVRSNSPGGWDLVRLNGRALPKKWRILLVMKGTAPELGTEFAQIHWVKASDLKVGGFTDVEVEYDSTDRASKWKGWADFEKVTDDLNIQFVFGYGSLIKGPSSPWTREVAAAGFVADLQGFRRDWGIAMDNNEDLPGYKFYVDPVSGVRPDIAVAFLDIVEDCSSMVNGVCLPVTDAELEELDSRERNYERVEVTQKVSGAPGKIWAYRGTSEGRSRRAAGDALGRTRIHEGYLEGVKDSFNNLPAGERDLFDESTDEPKCPVIPLVRRDLP